MKNLNYTKYKKVLITGHNVFKNKVFWQCMDSKRDNDKLEQIYKMNKFE